MIFTYHWFFGSIQPFPRISRCLLGILLIAASNLTSCKDSQHSIADERKEEFCRSKLLIKNETVIFVKDYEVRAGFLDSTFFCKIETQTQVLDEIFEPAVANAIKRKTIFVLIQPEAGYPHWWYSLDKNSLKWTTKPIMRSGYNLDFVFIENDEGYTIFGRHAQF